MFSCLGKSLGCDRLSSGSLVCRCRNRSVDDLVRRDDTHTVDKRSVPYQCLGILRVDRNDQYIHNRYVLGTVHGVYLLTLVPTTYVGMIVYRLWNARDDARDLVETGSRTRSPKTTRLDSIIRIVIDSALGYTLVSLTLFFSQIARSNALYITSGAVSFWLTLLYTSVTLTLEFCRRSRPLELHSISLTFASQI